jgi:uncharacterized membrane protein YbhN (UPF0104 family)
VCVAVFWRRDLLKRFVTRFVTGADISGFRASAGRVIEDILDEFSHLGSGRLLKLTLLTLVAWILHYSFFVFAASSLGIHASVPILVMSISAAIFVGLIPISISGVGTRDLVLIMIFSRVGLTEEQAVTFSLTFIGVYIIIGLAGLVCWLAAPFKMGSVEKS